MTQGVVRLSAPLVFTTMYVHHLCDSLFIALCSHVLDSVSHFNESLTSFPTGTDSSPPSLTLRISKDQLQGLSSSSSSSGKTSQSGLSRQQQPRSKLTRSKAWLQGYLSSGDPLKMFLAAVYEHTDSTGVCVAEAFHELPSAKVSLLRKISCIYVVH